ncbi:Iron only hydrogenase large subunit, C-terminal domain [Ruminococcus sp. YE71]|uniref:[Fe-Fe] hydrogenase large subunit C-terminal domain-containing protein n=1 Tax=unclassified Ruminococcus TaxID=2608920 RepID=UPI0008842903|nr:MULTISPECIES: [Fe-Fe] hydrogenase large subunit C-terminal domain-containing protein [unclassified Ruminococcus]SDA15883.1 Iron only hydrogenase large subunit, C-terminal domain [Ruminococcus sp. YE78]SFW23391.1 Iron only hydrogenase large subunit, C-terminal domain [Ruminococcus sp. YE71]
MADLIIVRPDKCVGCNACVRVCPATEANITKILEDGRFVTTVNNDRCIACGECVKACNHGARDYLDDTEAAMSRMNSDKLIILAAPSIKSAFPTQWKGILDWFKKKGCIIYDVSFGADICSWAHLRAIQNKKVGNIITQPCAAIVKYIEMYQPKLLQNLSPIHSPVMCEATYVRKYLRRNNPIAMLSPCIAKKNEFIDTGLIDYNITFKKLKEYFDKNDIRIPTNSAQELDYSFDDQQGQMGSVYSRPGGLRDNLWLFDPDINITTSEGAHKVYPELDMYAQMPEFKHPEVFDVLSCEFGCNVGPGTGTAQSVFDVMATMREVEKDAKARRKTSGAFNRGEDKLYKKFDDELRLADFMRNYRPQKPTPVPTDKQLESVYELMGKHNEDERSYDCHACGYNSCRDMAISIYRGLNTPENCIVHAKSVLLARHSALQEQHEKLEEITNECLALSDKLKADVDMITENVTNIGDANTKTHERAGVVNNLLQNVVAFCKGNSTMDAGSVQQLIGILETTIKAFGALDENVTKTSESSKLITESIEQITQLVDELNDTLHKTAGEL